MPMCFASSLGTGQEITIGRKASQEGGQAGAYGRRPCYQATIRSAFVRRKDPSQRAVRSWGQGRYAGTIIFCASSRGGQRSNSQVVPSVTSHPVCGLFAVRGTPGSDWDCPKQVGDKTRRLSCFMGHTTAPTGRIAI
jgi:hypothetical protein